MYLQLLAHNGSSINICWMNECSAGGLGKEESVREVCVWWYRGRKGHGGISHTRSPNSEVPAHWSILGGETEMWFTGIPEIEGTLTLSTDQKTGNLRRSLRKEYGSTQPSQPTWVLLVTILWPSVTGSSQASL